MSRNGARGRAIVLSWCLLLASLPGQVQAQSSPAHIQGPVTARRVALELYTRSKDAEIARATNGIRRSLEHVQGIRLRVVDLDQQPQLSERLVKIGKAYQLGTTALPFLYGLNHYEMGVANEETWKHRIDNLLLMEVFTRTGCPHCEGLKRYLPHFQTRYPALHVKVMDVVADATAYQRLRQLTASQHTGGSSLPLIWLCQQSTVGFDTEAVMSKRLDDLLHRWTFDWEPPAAKPKTSACFMSPGLLLPLANVLIAQVDVPARNTPVADARSTQNKTPQATSSDGDLPINEGGGADELPIDTPDSKPVPHTIRVPWLGELNVDTLGMPLFTLLIGLVDGFNPCAMWVLLFLLSVLVNLNSRWKILLVAGTFVVISGLAYLAFMAAWLNILLLIGFLRGVQITLGILAICVGAIHIKDYFAFKKGISLSIPESAKPGIYNQVRRIVMAENLCGALIGASILAVLVNLVELLCTAGLPALYSQILTLRHYPVWLNYSYLGLYILAYMADDILMVGLVVITLDKRRLAENQGRWLKLISGLVILALGIMLLVKPEWLV